MKFLKFIFIFLTPVLVNAANVKSTVPIFNQKLEFSYSTDYKIGFQQTQAGVFMMELIPKKDSVENWTEMLTVSGYKDLASAQTPDSAMKLESDSIKAACPKDFVFEKIDYKHSQNYPVALAIVGCSKHPTLAGKSELALQLVIKGKKDIYMLKKAFHQATNAKDSLSKANYKARADELLNVQVCKNDGQSPICKADPN